MPKKISEEDYEEIRSCVLRLIELGDKAPDDVRRILSLFTWAIAPYANNAAYEAFLELKRDKNKFHINPLWSVGVWDFLILKERWSCFAKESKTERSTP
jgi:hypothetical protein